MLTFTKHYNNSILRSNFMLLKKVAVNTIKTKNNTCNYLQVQIITANNNNYVSFNNKINTEFNDHIQITKRYLHKAEKLLPINMIELDKRLWINSEFYNSYRHNPEVWHEINLSTNKTKCINIKKIISLYHDYPKIAEQKLCYSMATNQQEIVVENQDNEHLTELLADKINTIAFGELGSGNPFIINYSAFTDYNTGSIVITNNWEDIMDYINQQEVNLFILGMHHDSLKQITALQQQNNKYNNFTNLKLLLKQNLT